MAGDRGEHAALGGAVELGEHEARDLDGLVEGFDLLHGVLADAGIEHQQHFMRAGGVGFLDHAPYFGDFFHQVQLRGQTAGGVGQHHIDVARARGADGIEYDGGRIAGCLGDDADAIALTPGGELLACCGAKGVAGGQQDALALALKVFRQLADGGGFSRAIHAGNHHDERLVRGYIQRLFQRGEQRRQTCGQHFA